MRDAPSMIPERDCGEAKQSMVPLLYCFVGFASSQ
jgi:hypothetical protein